VTLDAATLGESGAEPMHPRIKPAWPGAQIDGPAYAVRCEPGDNLAIHAAVAAAPPGSVIVAAVDPPERGYWGEVLTTAAEARGLAGLVIDGGVRDIAAIEVHGFPVFSALSARKGATKTAPGDHGGTTTVGDVLVRTGDWIVGDRDGVVVLPSDRIEEINAKAAARAEKEAAMFPELRAGATTIELLGLQL
jgi:4-hydroxy-4-methyl-2-oxoglutarate aldolase